MALLQKDQIKSKSKLSLKKLHVREWDGDIVIQSLTVKQSTKIGTGDDVKLLAVSIVEADDSIQWDTETEATTSTPLPLMFTTDDDMEALNRLSVKTVNAIGNAILELNGIGQEEDLGKGS